jgi:hypothetical protein
MFEAVLLAILSGMKCFFLKPARRSSSFVFWSPTGSDIGCALPYLTKAAIRKILLLQIKQEIVNQECLFKIKIFTMLTT